MLQQLLVWSGARKTHKDTTTFLSFTKNIN
jgi:hypothetical protein